MLYLPFIISNILSAAVSAAVTVYLLRYFVIKHRDELFGAPTASRHIAVKSTEPAPEERQSTVVQTQVAQSKTTEETILSSFVSSKESENRFSTISPSPKSTSILVVLFRSVLQKFLHLAHKIVHLLSIGLDRVFTGLFAVVGMLLGIVLIPLYKLLYKTRSALAALSFAALYEKVTNMVSKGRRLSQRDLEEAIQVLETPELLPVPVEATNEITEL